MPAFTFSKKEHLKSSKVIAALFSKGESKTVFPLKLIWMDTTDLHAQEFPIEFGLTVPKRSFKKAVDRNRIKRLIREAYRLNKYQFHSILKDKKKNIAVMVIYIGKKEMRMKKIEKAIIKSFGTLIDRLE